MLGVFSLALLFTKASAQREATVCVDASEFVAVDESINYLGAEERCVEKGGRLAVPFNEVEHNATLDLSIALGGAGNFWLGILSLTALPRLCLPNFYCR